MEVPARWIGRTIGELDIRRRYGISIIGVRRSMETYGSGQNKSRTEVMILPELMLKEKMTLLVLGDDASIKKCFK